MYTPKINDAGCNGRDGAVHGSVSVDGRKGRIGGWPHDSRERSAHDRGIRLGYCMPGHNKRKNDRYAMT